MISSLDATGRAITSLDIFPEHLDEAAFLWTQWEDALVAANFTLDEVAAGPEERLRAHLDGLVLGGRPVAEQLLLPALGADEPERIAAAAWVLIQAEDGDDYQDAVIDVLVKADAPARSAVARALELSPRAEVSRLKQHWNEGKPAAVRASVLDLVSRREPEWAVPHLPSLLRGAEGTTLASALRALRRAPDRRLLGLVEAVLAPENREGQREAITTGIVIGSKMAWDACRRSALGAGGGDRTLLALLAMSPEPTDRAMVLAAARDPRVKRRHAIWALGFTGDLQAADLLVEEIEDQRVARAAAEALSAITGVAIAGPLARPGDTRSPALDEVRDDDPPPVVRPEDHLPRPDPAGVKRWWQRERAHFSPGVRRLFGRPRTPEALRSALRTAPMWRREVIWWELAATTGEVPAVDLNTWAWGQARTLGGAWSGAARLATGVVAEPGMR